MNVRPEISTRLWQMLGVVPGGAFQCRALGCGIGGATWRVQTAAGIWFVKTQADALGMFNAEADGLRALADCHAARVPKVLGTGEEGGEAFLVMEWLLLGRKTQHAAARMGEALARQHQGGGERFGWRRHNFIGATPQFNTPADDWTGFFREYRLGFQLRLAAENGYRGALQDQGTELMERLPAFFAGYTPQPSLLHGDLWSGNWGVLDTGEPVIFDPAVYYGDREADLAMTELFGGFSPEFYSAYDAHWPRDSGHRTRRDLYNLYHVLNHLNLFGTGYLAQAQQLMQRLLAQVRH